MDGHVVVPGELGSSWKCFLGISYEKAAAKFVVSGDPFSSMYLNSLAKEDVSSSERARQVCSVTSPVQLLNDLSTIVETSTHSHSHSQCGTGLSDWTDAFFHLWKCKLHKYTSAAKTQNPHIP